MPPPPSRSLLLPLLTLLLHPAPSHPYSTCSSACLEAGKPSNFCTSRYPEGGDGDADCCAADGADSAYEETIVGNMRSISVNGCPDHPYFLVNPNVAHPLEEEHLVPAYPELVAISDAKSLSAVGGTIGTAINGVSLYSCYGGADYGECLDWDSSAINLEGDTFDSCGGHATGFYQYHYHIPPTCLLNALGATTDAHSPQIGWAYDGFPIYGGRGPGGVLMKKEGADGADSTYFLDTCGGYEGALPVDPYLYRYYMTGTVSDGTSNPVSPLPGESFFPHAPICLRGCCPAGEDCR